MNASVYVVTNKATGQTKTFAYSYAVACYIKPLGLENFTVAKYEDQDSWREVKITQKTYSLIAAELHNA